MLRPKKVKFRKKHRGRMRGKAVRGSKVNYGKFGLKAMEPAWITERQIEAARIALTQFMKEGGKVWIRTFPDHPVTAQPAETRMGKGKGTVDRYVARVKPGRIILELAGLDYDNAKIAMKRAEAKIPIKGKFVERGKYE